MPFSPRLKSVSLVSAFLVLLFATLTGFHREVVAAKTVVTVEEFDIADDEPSPIHGVCSFPIYLSSWGHVRISSVMDVSDPAFPIPIRIYAMHTDFHFLFEANGIVLESEQASYMITFFYEDGLFRDFHTVGQGGKVPLPDGSTFSSAGLISLKFFPDEGVGFFEDGSVYFMTVGTGNAGDVTALCDALSN